MLGGLRLARKNQFAMPDNASPEDFSPVRSRTRGGIAAKRILLTIQEWADQYARAHGSVCIEDLLADPGVFARITNCIDDEFFGLVADVFSENRN